MEPAHFEAALNGDVNKFPFCDIEREDLSEIFSKVSPSGNSLLHVASSSGHKEMIQLIARKFPLLITKQNSEGNTALHLAARAHKLNSVRALVDLSKQNPNTSTSTDTLLTMKNDDGNTALHEALFAIHASKKHVNILVDVACYLVLNDPDVTYLQNKAGKSPLCMAVESGNKAIVEYILNALPDQGDGLLQRLEGKSPVHVAIELGKLDMLKIIKEQKEELLLLRDEEGNTPLHFAAYIGCSEGVRYLLEIKSNWAFGRNNKGYYPLHLACENGHIKVTKVLFRKWPDPTELLCNKGQNILHAAVKSGKDNMVRYVLKRKGTYNLVNKMDRNGNTPSHLAALLGHSMVVFTLLCDKRSNVDVLNYQGFTAYDIFKANILTKVLIVVPYSTNFKEGYSSITFTCEAIKLNLYILSFSEVQDQEIDDVHDRNIKAFGVEENSVEVDMKKSGKPKKFQMMMVYSMLYIYYEYFRRFWQIIRRHHHNSTKTSHIKIKPPVPKQDLNNTINYLFVVAALVVGAAFAGVLQIPYDSSTDNDGKAPAAPPPPAYIPGGVSPKDGNKKILSYFLYTLILTMNLAVIAAFGLFLALLLDANLGSILVSVSFLLLELSLIYMGSSFLYAMLLRMKIIGDVTFFPLSAILDVFQYIPKVLVIITVLFFTLGRERSALIIYFILFCFYFPLYRLWSIFSFTPLKTLIKFVICALYFCGLVLSFLYFLWFNF